MRDLVSTVGAALRSRPPANQAPVPFTSSRTGLFGGDQFADPGATADRAYAAMGAVGTLFAIVTQIGYAVSTVEWHLYQRTSVKDRSRRKEIVSHPFLTVWNMPNPFMTGKMFRRAVQQHLDLVGEAVIVLNVVGDLIYEMWPVRPDRIRPVKHPTQFLTGYVYIGPDGEEVPLELDRVIHIKMPNPVDPYRGMGPVQTVLNDVDAATYSAAWNRNFFINGARPGGIITLDYKMGETEWRQFIDRWRQQHQGVANAHRVAVLENAKWQDTNFSMTDMQFVELRNLPRELIREAFAFPKPMLGTVDDVNRANAQAGKEIMADSQTEPRLSLWKDVVNTYLLPRFTGGKVLEVDYDDPTPTNREDIDRERISQSTAARNLVLSGWHPDDVAIALGMPPMRWIGMPSAATNPMQADQLPDYSQPEEPPAAIPAGRNKPVIDITDFQVLELEA